MAEADKPPLLFLAHRIPYPPNKGDKIRSWHMLRYLAEHFSIYLGTFVDDPDDWMHCAVLRRHCAGVCFIERRPAFHKILATRALLGDAALSVEYYRSAELQTWVDRVVEEAGIERALLFCSPMARFVAPGTRAGRRLRRTVLDLVDMDSEKWRQYGEARSGLRRWLFLREARTLLSHERAATAHCAATYLVSPEEAALYRSRVPEYGDRIDHCLNGVDTTYFKPGSDYADPYAPGSRVLVFTGAMDYQPNIDAVVHFARAVFPSLRNRYPKLQFWIVGSKPDAAVTALCVESGVHVTGRVPDVRPYLQHALAAVAPLRIARGIQNKVLEAMAMARPVLASADALAGIEFPTKLGLDPVETVEDHLTALETLLAESDRPAMPLRAWMEARFAWDARLSVLPRALLMP